MYFPLLVWLPVPRFENRLDGCRAHALDRAEAKSNLRPHRVVHFAVVTDRLVAKTRHVLCVVRRVNHGEIDIGFVDVRWQDGDPHRARLGHRANDFVDLFSICREGRAGELHRVMRLEIRGLIGDQRVRR